MKRFIIASICTLVISLLGAFGIYQNSLNYSFNSTPASGTVTTIDQKSLPDGDQTEVTQVTAPAVTATPAPTKVPAATATPVPTKAPEATATPVPTKVPAATATPAPTKVPAATATPVLTKAPAATATPKPTMAPTSAPTPTVQPKPKTDGIGTYAGEVLRLVNIERAKAGLSAYTTNSAISSAADKRAKEIAASFSHTRPDGTSFYTVLEEYGISYRAAGENIAYGQKTPQEVVNGWMNSAGHKANILNSNFNKIGIGVYEVNGVIYWTQEFTN